MERPQMEQRVRRSVQAARQAARAAVREVGAAREAKIVAIKAADEHLDKPLIPYVALQDQEYLNHYKGDQFWWLSEWDTNLEDKKERFILGKKQWTRKQIMAARAEKMFSPPPDGPSGDQHQFAMSSVSSKGKRQAAELRLHVAREKIGSDYDEDEVSNALHALLPLLKQDCDFEGLLRYAKEAFHHACKCMSLSDQALAFEAMGNAYYHMSQQEHSLKCHKECLRLLNEAEHHELGDLKGRVAIVKSKVNARCNIGHTLLRMGLMTEAGEEYERAYWIAQRHRDEEGLRAATEALSRLNSHTLTTESQTTGPGQSQRWLLQTNDRAQSERVGRRSREAIVRARRKKEIEAERTRQENLLPPSMRSTRSQTKNASPAVPWSLRESVYRKTVHRSQSHNTLKLKHR